MMQIDSLLTVSRKQEKKMHIIALFNGNKIEPNREYRFVIATALDGKVEFLIRITETIYRTGGESLPDGFTGLAKKVSGTSEYRVTGVKKGWNQFELEASHECWLSLLAVKVPATA